MHNRRVLHLIDTGGPGGAETVFADVVSGLSDRWESKVVIPERDWLHRRLTEERINAIELRSNGSFDVRYLARLVQLIRSLRISLIHAHLLTSSVYGSIAASLTRVPLVATFHGQNDFRPTESFRALKAAILNRRRNRLVFVSQSLRKHYLAQSRFDPARTTVVPNGIAIDDFRNGAGHLRSELGLGPEHILIGAVGNVRPAKDYATFIRAAAQLRRVSEAYRFVIAGDTRSPDYDRLCRLANELGVADIVSFLGFREDVRNILRSIDVYVSSSSAEGFSLTTVQAMACERPVVATRCGGPEDIVRHGETGILVEVGSPQALAAAIESLGRDPETRARLGRAARTDVSNRFSRSAMIAAYERVYQWALSGDRTPDEALPPTIANQMVG